MSLKYGLNVAKKSGPPARKAIFDDDEYGEDEPRDNTQPKDEEISTVDTNASRQRPFGISKPTAPPKSCLDGPKQDFSAHRASQAKVKEAEQLDSSIFDYDSFHDAKSTVLEAKKAAQRQDAVERKPKYINNLLDAAARRKQDQAIAKEKALQREREAEGDEFADKEKFVTGAYKQQQEENRRLEEEEKRKAEEEEKRKRQLGGGLQSLYRNMMDQTEKLHQEALDAAAKFEREGGVREANTEQRKTDAQLAAEMNAKGANVHINEEGQVTDKRELLSAGLNIVPSGRSSDQSRGADHLRTSHRSGHSALDSGRNAASQQAQRERQTRMMEEQLEAQAKRAREEEEQEIQRAEKAARTTKTEQDVSDAKARYLARKAAKARGEG